MSFRLSRYLVDLSISPTGWKPTLHRYQRRNERNIPIRYVRECDPTGTKLNSTVTRSVLERARRISSVSVNL
jgi:hypothetical protein